MKKHLLIALVLYTHISFGMEYTQTDLQDRYIRHVKKYARKYNHLSDDVLNVHQGNIPNIISMIHDLPSRSKKQLMLAGIMFNRPDITHETKRDIVNSCLEQLNPEKKEHEVLKFFKQHVYDKLPGLEKNNGLGDKALKVVCKKNRYELIYKDMGRKVKARNGKKVKVLCDYLKNVHINCSKPMAKIFRENNIKNTLQESILSYKRETLERDLLAFFKENIFSDHLLYSEKNLNSVYLSSKDNESYTLLEKAVQTCLPETIALLCSFSNGNVIGNLSHIYSYVSSHEEKRMLEPLIKKLGVSCLEVKQGLPRASSMGGLSNVLRKEDLSVRSTEGETNCTYVSADQPIHQRANLKSNTVGSIVKRLHIKRRN